MQDYQDQSNYKRYCIGIVALDKKLYEDTIEAMPVDNAAMLEGELNDKWDEVNVSGKDGERQDYQNKAKFVKTIKATWMGMHQYNRMTSPDVRRGDKVQIYRLGDSNVFYWDTLDSYDKIRRLETVVHGYSATKSEGVSMNPDNTYVQGVSTHEKMVTLIYTSKDPTNGEEFRYGIFIDTKNNHIVIKDDIENRIVLQSKPHLIRLETMDNGFIQIDKLRITSKGTWYHRGTFTAEEDIYSKTDVHSKLASLESHVHPETQTITRPRVPASQNAPWDPHPDELKVDYREPWLLK